MVGILLAVFLFGAAGCSDPGADTAETQAVTEAAAETGTLQEIPETEETLPAATVPTQRVSLRYWDVELPEDISVEEYAKEDSYRADFSITVEGDRILLYSVQLGEPVAENVLGVFADDSGIKKVSVRTYTLATQIMMPNETVPDRFLDRMKSLEIVIQAIRENSKFSEDLME